MDIVSKKTRSLMMSKIRSKDTKIEVLVRSRLFKEGFRFRKNDKRLKGSPDVVLPIYKTLIFVHGCFWHGHEDCKEGRLPKSNVDFWREKIGKNIERDEKNEKFLIKEGWNVLKIWECKLVSDFEKTMSELLLEIEK